MNSNDSTENYKQMKKQPFILTLLAVVAILGLGQRIYLHHLREKNSELRSQQTNAGESERTSPRSRSERSQKTDGLSSDEVSRIHEEMVDFFQNFKQGQADQATIQKIRMDFYKNAQNFSAENIAELASLFKGDPDFPWKVVGPEFLHEIFVDTIPFEVMDYVENNPNLQQDEFLFVNAFRKSLQQDLPRAMKRYEEGVEMGDPKFQTSSIRSSLLIGLAPNHTEQMLNLAISPEFQADTDAVMHLGGFLDDRLETPEEFMNFLFTVERVMDEKGDSEFLQTVRKDFIRESQQKIRNWNFEGVEQFVSGAMSQDEQFGFLANTRNIAGFEEPEKWADWFQKITLDDWRDWAGDDPALKKHPLESLIQNATRGNLVDLGEKVLTQMAKGELRNEVMLTFAWSLADRYPEKAATYLDQLPQSKGRKRLVKKIAAKQK